MRNLLITGLISLMGCQMATVDSVPKAQQTRIHETPDVYIPGVTERDIPLVKYPKELDTLNYCAVFAVAIVDRILGLADFADKITKEEWEQTATELGTTHKTGTPNNNTVLHYTSRGFSVKEVEVTSCDVYAQIKDEMNSGCAAIIHLQNLDPEAWLGHVEAVIKVDHCELFTDSSGEKASVTGFSSTKGPGGFIHSEFKKAFPKDGTDFTVMLVCPK